jgi:hypothetical protein
MGGPTAGFGGGPDKPEMPQPAVTAVMTAAAAARPPQPAIFFTGSSSAWPPPAGQRADEPVAEKEPGPVDI